MFIDINSIQIKVPNGNYINLGNYNNTNRCLLVEAKYQYNKLWSSDSGRNLAGKQTGTLIGIFPKIILQFGKLTKEEYQAIRPILDAPRQVIKYYDPKDGATEMNTYTGDYEITNKSIINSKHKNEGFSVSFISIEKR